MAQPPEKKSADSGPGPADMSVSEKTAKSAVSGCDESDYAGKPQGVQGGKRNVGSLRGTVS